LNQSFAGNLFNLSFANYLMIRPGYFNNKLKDDVIYDDPSIMMILIEIGGRYYFFDARIVREPFCSIKFLFSNDIKLYGLVIKLIHL